MTVAAPALPRTDEEAMSTYLDIHELAALLGQSTRTIQHNLVNCPHLVPPKMHIPSSRMLRWRRHEVEAWMFETGVWNGSPPKECFCNARFDANRMLLPAT